MDAIKSIDIKIYDKSQSGAPEPRGQGQLPPPLPLLHGGSAGAEKCPFAM